LLSFDLNLIKMTRILTLCFVLLPFSGFSQNYINKTKAQVKKELNDYISKNDTLNASISETDTATILSVKGPKTLPADFIYRFDKAGKCKSEKIMAGCDSCFTKYFQAVLDRKKFEWKKINENQYVSNFAAKMLIELPGDDKNFSFIILRTDWTKEMYDLLTGKQ
jgi:hypothetical protein